MEAMAHRNRWFSQLETSIYEGFSMAMLNNQRVFATYQSYQQKPVFGTSNFSWRQSHC